MAHNRPDNGHISTPPHPIVSTQPMHLHRTITPFKADIMARERENWTLETRPTLKKNIRPKNADGM